MNRIEKIFRITAIAKYLDFMNILEEDQWFVFILSNNLLNYIEVKWYYKTREPICLEYSDQEYNEEMEKHYKTEVNFEKYKKLLFIWNNYINLATDEELDKVLKEIEEKYWKVLPEENKLKEYMLMIMALNN